MIVLVAGIVAAGVVLWCLRDHQGDDPRRRHPSTGGANRLNPPKQPSHVRILTESEDR